MTDVAYKLMSLNRLFPEVLQLRLLQGASHKWLVIVFNGAVTSSCVSGKLCELAQSCYTAQF